MKKTIIATLLTTTLTMAYSSVFAMDINNQKISSANPANELASLQPGSFADSEYPDSGIFFHIDLNRGHIDNKTMTFPADNVTTYHLTSPDKSSKASSMGIGIGYQNSNIQNHILKFLQVKRVSVALDYYRDSKFSQQGIIYNQVNQRQYSYDLNVKAANRLMLDGKANIFKIWHLSPYLEAGAGIAKYQAGYTATFNTTTLTNAPIKETKFVYQLGLGLDWFISKGLTLGIGYRYIDAGKLALPSKAITATAQPANLPLKYKEWTASLGYSF